MAHDRIVLIGGHGKVALLAAPKLAQRGFDVDALIRNPGHAADVEAAGARPIVLDIESASVDELAEAFAGAAAVVFSAGAGGGNPARTRAVDFEAAVRAMDAAGAAGVDRFVLVSYARAAVDVDRLDPGDSFFPYAQAKHDADDRLRASNLDYTILGPGTLTLDDESGRVRLLDERGVDPVRAGGAAGANGEADVVAGGGDGGTDALHTSRANVAEVIAHVVASGAASRATVNFADGDTPIADAVR